MTNHAPSYHGYRFPPEIISHAVWLYHRFCLSFRDAEDLLAQRGITVTYETIRHWCQTFGPAYARRLRRRRGRMGDAWYLDELFVTIRGQRQYLWRAVDQDGDVIDILVQPRRDRHAAARFFCLGAQLAISVNNCPPPRDPRSRMTSFKRTQRKYVQKAYRVRNWREYETGLRARGSLTVWLGLTDGKLANWNSPRPTRRKPGRQRKYSNHAIETTVTLGLVFGLASRQTEGCLRSLLTLLNLDNDVPDHSTISRRKARLGKVASYERRTVKPVHLLIDSNGLSVHVGQLRTPPKARDYRKLHLAVDEQTSDVVACELTSKRARDASRVASLVGQIERPIASAKADAAYDTGDVYTTLENHRAHRSPKVLIPPRTGAQLALDSAGTRQRNRNIRARSRVGKRKWYVASGYSRRSKVETTFHRYKAILGSAMRARGLASQRVEVRLGCKILNTMTALGIPDGEMIG